ncbi:LamG domain-containing protein [Streptomyces arenae]|uniref:LamG domain-containing protein n=1 Tax=Streptomyces arenae TaxID=29301 RepID=UPI002659C01B|nr:LamG domain-containing protein [Streptomyces arenae]MCG7205851.1 laminin G domain-containing protein [Streptomyces arenae]
MSLAAVVAVSAGTLTAIPAPAVAGQNPQAQLTEAQKASQEAVDSNERVEVKGDRTEYATTYANPDGSTFSLSLSTVPVRVERADGSWAEPDATLERRADGTVGPRAAVADVSFSGGGDGAGLVTVAEGGRSLTVGWPGTLPEPTLDGASAVYSEVLPGVDLRMTATTEGYREALVVKTAGAAASDELKRLDFPVRAEGLTLSEGAGGGLNAVDADGNAVFRTPTARQWDSAGDTATPAGTSAMSLRAADTPVASDGAEAPDPAAGPSDGDASAVLPVTADDDSITVVPDAGLLTGDDTVFPLYIDPDVSWGESERTLLSSDGDTFYNFSGGDDGEGVGYCGTYVTGGYAYYCGSGYKQRMYFEFAPTALRGKRVLDATFRVTERWSMSCTHTTVQLVRTPNISSATRWPGPTSGWDIMGDRTVSAGRGSACDPSQPDAPIEFNDDPAQNYENLTDTVKSFAAGDFSRLTLMLKAYNESDPNGWKRFDDDAVLDVDYVGVPAPPTSPGVLSGEISSCETDASDPAVLSDPTPTFSAVAQTLSGGESEANLRTHFYVQKKATDGTWAVVTEPVRPVSPGYVNDNQKVSVSSPVTLADGGTYRMAVFTRSYYNGGASYLESHSTVTTKGWCYFKVDTTAPKAPVITFGTKYTACTANACAPAGGPGVKDDFTFSPASGDAATVVGYRYKLSSSSAWSATVTGTTVKKAIAPDLAGTQVLQVRALDNVGSGRWGAIASVKFNVQESQGATGRWHFDDGVANSGVTLAADSAATEGTRHPATLYTTGAGWSGFGRRGDGDRSLWLNDTSDTTRQSGYAATSTAAVNTQSSYTVSAWAYLTESTEYRAVLSQTGSDDSGFVLYYSAGAKRWVFRYDWSDSAGTRHYVTNGADAEGPVLKVWTHVAAVYDADAKTIQLYVNGRAQGDPVAVPAGGEKQTPDGALQIGRASYAHGTYTQYWRGRIDEVAVFQEALRPGDVAKEARLLDSAGTATATELVAAWNPEGASGTTLADTVSGYGRSLTLTGGAALDGEAIVLDGTDDAAGTAGPVVDETGSFTVTTEVELDQAALNAKGAGFIGQVLGQRTADGSAWGLWYETTGTETRFDDDDNPYEVPVGFWRFGRLAADGTFTAVDSDSTAVVGSRVRLTGVYDAQAGTVALYLDSTQNDTDTPFTAVVGSGELAVGKDYVRGAWGHYLPGRISDIRIWAGAAADGTQLDTMIGG